MRLDELLTAPLRSEFTVSNQPFTFAGKATMELDGGEARHWLFDNNGRMLSVSPSEEEVLSFRLLDEAMEPENETVVYQGKDYEYSYEDIGSVSDAEGDTQVEPEERYAFSDYEADDGELIRLVRNENTGDTMAFIGSMVGEDDVIAVE